MAIGRISTVLALGAFVVVAALGGETLSAPAARAEAFGEIAQVGQFGTGAGEFHWPSGLAVDPEEGNSVFVLDEPEGVSQGIGENAPASFRIQKFASVLGTPTGEVLVPTPQVGGHAQIVDEIAVDPALSRLYVLKGIETGNKKFPSSLGRFAAEEIEMYSTKTLAPEGVFYTFPVMPEEAETIPAGVLLIPDGLAVDPTTHDLIVLGKDYVRDESDKDETVIQRIVAVASAGPVPYPTGTLYHEEFDDTSESIGRAASGVAVGPEGSIYLSDTLLHTSQGERPGVVKLSGPSLADPTITLVHADEDSTKPRLTGGQGAENFGVDFGPQVAVSPEGGLVYAAEVSAEESGTLNAKEEVEYFPGDYEIRGMSTVEGSGLGDQQVVLGGGKNTCLIASTYQAIAAGSGGVVYVLDEGAAHYDNIDGENDLPSPYGFHLIEFGPGGSGCPTPSAVFAIDGDGSSPAVTVKKGEPVTFEAQAGPLNGEEPVELDWDLEGTGAYATKVTGTPAELKTTNEYYKSGAYTIGLKIFLLNNGTYGNPPPVTRKIEVVAPPPIASFEASNPNPKPGEPVTFNGGGSLDPAGSCTPGHGCGPTPKMKSYEWQFGDGKTEKTESPQYTRSFANSSTEARSESVSLVVTNEEGVPSTTSSQTLTIQGTPETSKEPTKEPTKEPVKEAPKEPIKEAIKEVIPVGKTTPPAITPPVKKPLTRAQKLANALKACKKDKSKKARTTCEKQAKNKYAPPKTKKKKTGKKGK